MKKSLKHIKGWTYNPDLTIPNFHRIYKGRSQFIRDSSIYENQWLLTLYDVLDNPISTEQGSLKEILTIADNQSEELTKEEEKLLNIS